MSRTGPETQRRANILAREHSDLLRASAAITKLVNEGEKKRIKEAEDRGYNDTGS